MYDRFTDRARRVMKLARDHAWRLRNEYIGTEHVLLGLVEEGSGVAANVLRNMGIDLKKLSHELQSSIRPGQNDAPRLGKIAKTPRTRETIKLAIDEARKLNHNYVGTEHLLLGILREGGGDAAQILMKFGLKLEDVREEVFNLLGHALPTDQSRTESAGTYRSEGGSMMISQSADMAAATESMSAMFGPAHIDQIIRQAIQFCWMSLPKERKTVDEVESQMRRLLDRALQNLREDSQAFGLGGQPEEK